VSDAWPRNPAVRGFGPRVFGRLSRAWINLTSARCCKYARKCPIRKRGWSRRPDSNQRPADCEGRDDPEDRPGIASLAVRGHSERGNVRHRAGPFADSAAKARRFPSTDQVVRRHALPFEAPKVARSARPRTIREWAAKCPQPSVRAPCSPITIEPRTEGGRPGSAPRIALLGLLVADVVVSRCSVKATASRAALPESAGASRTGRGPFARASQRAPRFPCTTRSPRFTCVSLGYPFRRLLVRSKAGEVVVSALGRHWAPPFAGSTNAGVR